MKRSAINLIIDLAMLCILSGIISIGLIMAYILPPGTGACRQELRGGYGRGPAQDLCSLTRHEWGTIHLCLGVLFASLVCIHIILHWECIKGYVRGIFKGSNC